MLALQRPTVTTINYTSRPHAVNAVNPSPQVMRHGSPIHGPRIRRLLPRPPFSPFYRDIGGKSPRHYSSFSI